MLDVGCWMMILDSLYIIYNIQHTTYNTQHTTHNTQHLIYNLNFMIHIICHGIKLARNIFCCAHKLIIGWSGDRPSIGFGPIFHHWTTWEGGGES